MAVLLAGLGLLPASAQTTVPVTIDAATELGPINLELGGLGAHTGGAPLATVAELHPYLVRIDGSLQDVSPAPGVLDLDRLLARVAEVRGIGAEPLVILSYMPAWLGAPQAFGRDPTRVPPADPDAWEAVVHDVVLALATAPTPVRRFEAWNEPDIPLFWQDTPIAFADTMVRSARAVARVERETGLDLVFGGPALAVPDPVYLAPFLAVFRDPSLPLDFVSWHYYGNLPFLGPDGTEFGETEAVQPVIGRPNPLTSPSAFGPQVELMRTWTAAALAGSGRPAPALLLDEWNLSSGGFDLRHDTNVGAAFDAGVLAELQDAGLDASSFFRANDTRTTGGDHGLVRTDGTRKAAWWTFWLWQQLAARQVPVTGTSEGLWAVASKDADRLTLFVASFSASQPTSRVLDVDVTGLGWTPASATLRRIDANHASADVAEPMQLEDGGVRLELPAQGVAMVELRRVAAAAPSPDATRVAQAALPATGGRGAWPGVAAVGAAMLIRRARVTADTLASDISGATI
ncbi:MAG: hypothetical protein QOG87_2586 [Actinomycetota bacterium]